ncbi:putative metal-nicotianamine transporter YSL5 [Cladobotryum mycophilum]|uniref:Metal-nicotianamine transporter YSL5 n=1 Tax=Cladobotryum mycophilum TaxID=491253 RepID=A0ABR0SNI0_9HYPO
MARDQEQCEATPYEVHLEGLTDDSALDPFSPFHDVEAPSSPRILTVRAVLLGSLCGALVNASNIYLGMKTGWGSSANILGSIIGFAVLKKLSTAIHPFGIHENNIVQTVATSSGGMSGVFISAIPALYQLGLLQTPMKDLLRLILLTASGGFFGLLSIAPLRQFFIRDVAMHFASDGAASAKKKLKATLFAFLGAMALRVTSQYAIGILWDWHVFTWFQAANVATSLAVSLESWGWLLEWSPAMVGSGMLVGSNVAMSFFLGSLLAWGIIGPYLVWQNIAVGHSVVTNGSAWAELKSYTGMTAAFANAESPSPRYWLLWSGVACMLAVALTELVCQYRTLWMFARSAIGHATSTMTRLRESKQQYSLLQSADGTNNYGSIEQSAMSEHSDNITRRMWLPGLIAAIIMTCLVTTLLFGMSVIETFLALGLAFFLSLVAIQAMRATDTMPVTAVSKVSQLLLNLISDFRIGYLLRTPPRAQYAAQLIGTAVAAIIAPSAFVLFTTAHPCILDVDESGSASCEFSGPSIAAWRAVAVAATESTLPIPTSSLYFSLIMAMVGSASVVLRQFGKGKLFDSIKPYVPNFMILALAFTIPSPKYGIAMLVGSGVAMTWKSRRPKSFEGYGFAIAAGLVAGEGIGGTINSILAISGVGGREWGIQVGCPAGRC